MEVKTVYFDNPGGENTDEVLRITKHRAEELGIKTILIATTYGNTPAKAVEVFNGTGIKVVAVTNSFGWRGPITEENRIIIESNGGTVLTCIQAFAGVRVC